MARAVVDPGTVSEGVEQVGGDFGNSGVGYWGRRGEEICMPFFGMGLDGGEKGAERRVAETAAGLVFGRMLLDQGSDVVEKGEDALDSV